jgi:hypothetical protein
LPVFWLLEFHPCDFSLELGLVYCEKRGVGGKRKNN